MIFGKDRACEERTQVWQYVMQADSYISHPRPPSPPLEQYETESVNLGTNAVETSSSMRACKRKRDRVSEVPNTKMVDMMSTFFTDVHSQIEALVSKVGTEVDTKGQMKNFMKELTNFPLSLEEKIIVTKKYVPIQMMLTSFSVLPMRSMR